MFQGFTDEFYMNEALKEAKKAYELGEVPVGAVVVCQQRIIARAHNQTEQLTDVTAHAEMIAITAAAQYLGSKYLQDCTLYVSLEPCPMCAGALSWAQLERLVFAASDKKKGYSFYEKSLLHPRTVISSGILEAPSRLLLQQFFKQRRNS